MSAPYGPNLLGAIETIVDTMVSQGITMTRAPYAPNYRGLVDALIDLKDGLTALTVLTIPATAGENLSAGDAVYLASTSGQAFKATASGTLEQAVVVGFAQANATTSGTVSLVVAGNLTTAGLTPGEIYYLSPTTPGAITTTAPSTATQFLVRVGEAVTATSLAIRIDSPIQLS